MKSLKNDCTNSITNHVAYASKNVCVCAYFHVVYYWLDVEALITKGLLSGPEVEEYCTRPIQSLPLLSRRVMAVVSHTFDIFCGSHVFKGHNIV